MKWKTTWSYLQIHYDTVLGVVENTTQRTLFYNNINGSKVKVRFSNKYGLSTLVLDEAVVSVVSEEERKSVTLTYQGDQKIILLPGQEYDSDEALLEVKAGERLEVSIYVKEAQEITSACSTYCKDRWNTVFQNGGNYVREDFTEPCSCAEVYPYVKGEGYPSDLVFGISGIQVLTEEEVTLISMFGDSITHMSYYMDALVRMTYEQFPGKYAILNRGIGGNRVLLDSAYVEEWPGHNTCAGIAAVKRYEEDLFTAETPDIILVLEGVNDVMHPYLLDKMDELPTAEELIAAYTWMIRTAHEKESKIYLGTILPYNYENAFQGPEGENVRKNVNEWIRTQKLSDGFFDFEEVTKDHEDPSRMIGSYHLGDGLHPNFEGGTVMAKLAADILFR